MEKNFEDEVKAKKIVLGLFCQLLYLLKGNTFEISVDLQMCDI